MIAAFEAQLLLAEASFEAQHAYRFTEAFLYGLIS
jgi:hypothetical protein